jgi:Uma2 family endonuclease
MYTRSVTAPLIRPYITYEDLCRLPSDGHRYELFEGEAYVAPSPFHEHQELVFRLALEFRQAIRDRSRVFVAPLDVVLGPATALQPDVVLILERNLGILQGVIRGVPDLVVEVLSPSTEAVDRGLKMETYARYGIGEYWIADEARAVLEVYRLDPEEGAYRLLGALRAGSKATTPFLPALSIDIAALFRA